MNVRHISKRESSFYTNKLLGTSTLWGWERLGRPILSPLQNIPTFLFIFQTFSLCYSFTVSEELRMNYSNERVNFSNLQTYWYFHIMGWGKTGPAHSFPPPKHSDFSFYLSDFQFMLLFHCTFRIKNELFQ